jgi:hypothetical protein
VSDRTERILVLVVTMIFCVTFFLIRPLVGTGKRKAQQKLPPLPVEACVEAHRCPKIVDIISVKGGIWDYPGEFFEAVLSNVVIKDTCTHCTNGVPAGSLKGTSDTNVVTVGSHSRPVFGLSDHIVRMLDEEHIIYTNRVTVGSLNGTSDTNMVTVYRRKWPVFGISDHIEMMIDNKIHIGTNIVHVGIYKDGMWTEADHIEKLLDDDARICTNGVPVDSKPANGSAQNGGVL